MRTDRIFNKLLYTAGLFTVMLPAMIFLSLSIKSLPAVKSIGWHFLTGKEWNPVTGKFGALPFTAGTLLTSVSALLISLPFSIAIALFSSEYYAGRSISGIVNYATDLLAAIPSVIFGFWGLFFLVPLIRRLQIKLGILPYGVGIFTASLVLAVMIIPYTSSVSREVIRLVPADLKEAAYALGATRYEVIKKIVFPYAASGIISGILLSFGRAIGETMAVTMVIGNSSLFPANIFAPSNTMASVIANEFTEAVKDIHLSSLIGLGWLLFIITFIVNLAGHFIIKKLAVNGKNCI